jgi:hypothetical protein
LEQVEEEAGDARTQEHWLLEVVEEQVVVEVISI